MVVCMGVTPSSCSYSLDKQKDQKDLVSILSDEDGNVRITPHALQELVSKSCLNMEGIYAPTTSIHKKGRSNMVACTHSSEH